MTKTQDNRIRTKLDTAEDICRIISSGAHIVLGTAIATENILQNATAEVLENLGYIGINGWSVIARAAVAIKRGAQDTSSFIYRALANKEQLLPYHELNAEKESIDTRLKDLIQREGLQETLKKFDLQGDNYNTKIKIDGTNIVITETKLGELELTKAQEAVTDEQAYIAEMQYDSNFQFAIFSHLKNKGIQLEPWKARNLVQDPALLSKQYSTQLADFQYTSYNTPHEYRSTPSAGNCDKLEFKGLSCTKTSANYQHKEIITEKKINLVSSQLHEGDLKSKLTEMNYDDRTREDIINKIISFLQDKLGTKEIKDLARDQEAYLASRDQEVDRLVTNERLAQRSAVNIPKTSYGVSILEEAALSGAGAAKRLIKGGKADKSKTLYQAVKDREADNQSTLAQATKKPLATLSSPISFVTKLLTGRTKQSQDKTTNKV